MPIIFVAPTLVRFIMANSRGIIIHFIISKYPILLPFSTRNAPLFTNGVRTKFDRRMLKSILSTLKGKKIAEKKI